MTASGKRRFYLIVGKIKKSRCSLQICAFWGPVFGTLSARASLPITH